MANNRRRIKGSCGYDEKLKSTRGWRDPSRNNQENRNHWTKADVGLDEPGVAREASTRRLGQTGDLPYTHKKVTKQICENYRGISLLSHIGKSYERILEKRLRNTVECKIKES